MTPPAAEKLPPTYNAGPLPSSKTVSACAVLSKPDPSGDHLEPFHFAMRRAATWAAQVKLPPAYRAGPLPSSNVAKQPTDVLIPTPSAEKLDPFHFAMLF